MIRETMDSPDSIIVRGILEYQLMKRITGDL